MPMLGTNIVENIVDSYPINIPTSFKHNINTFPRFYQHYIFLFLNSLHPNSLLQQACSYYC